MSPEARDVVGEIREYYRVRAGNGKYATSPDFNLREVETEYLSRWLDDRLKVLDVGCGNGYSTLCFASKFSSAFTGVDFVPEMIEAAQKMKADFETKGSIDFAVGDVTNLVFPDESFDVVCSQRCLLNLPTKEMQWRAVQGIARVLKPGGQYLMLEGTKQGLRRLNEVRGVFGMEPIPEQAAGYNWFSNKFDEEEMVQEGLKSFSRLKHIQRFGMYYFLSRVVHPLLVSPEEPKYDAKINEIARFICSRMPNFEDMGHVALFVWEK